MQLSQELVYEVHCSFIKQGTSLKAFCLKNEIDTGNIYRYLRGEINSEKAILARELVIKATFLDDDNDSVA